MRALESNSYDKSDLDLQRRVVNFLASRYRPTLKKLKVEARQGTITLTGKVTSFYEKQIAIGCCLRVAGAHRLIDLVEVPSAA